VGEVPPEPSKVAEVIAGEFGETVQVHGAEAARQMGLSTQVPTKPIFYTTGPNRRFYLGKLEVVLRHISPRKLALVGRPAGIALIALWYLGKHAVTLATLEQIRSRLEPPEFEKLRSATSSMPAWMSEVFSLLESEQLHA
jgi:hypothetical protein